MFQESTQTNQIYQALRSNRERYVPLWQDISRIAGIGIHPDYMWNNQLDKSQTQDEYVDDPTAAISVNQAGDYLLGIIWGTGEKVVDIIPSEEVEEEADPATMKEWYAYATKRLLFHMNHPDAGYQTALRPYAYDQFSFGTSGIGTFRNPSYLRGLEENALIFRQYGIDNTAIDEGKNGAPDIGYAMYHWTCARIVNEFAIVTVGEIDKALFAALPKRVQEAYNRQDYNQEFNIIFLWRPRDDFDPKMKGKRGTRYQGVWFIDEPNSNSIFCEEGFKERPINMCRMIKVRGEKYGRSSGTLLLSTIRAGNYIFALTAEILEKMANPPLGTFGNSIFGDSVLDTSPDGLTVFNATQNMGNNPPVFPLHDVGDPKGIIEFLLPYINEKVTTAFKIDALLDFNSAKDMTATESLQRYNIRGKSLSGMLGMQKNERVIPDCKRSISCLWDMGVFGVDASKDPERAAKLKAANKSERIIPDAVLRVVASGKPWYTLRFNNELEKLIRTEQVQALTQIIQAITAISGLYPPIIEAINWYQLLKDLNDALDYNNKILVNEKDFKQIIANAAKQKATAVQTQFAQGTASAQKDSSVANKNNAQVQGAINGGQINAQPQP